MTILEKRRNNGSGDMFPIGMRVLAVDDNPTCLKILEYLLIKCQYHVTTTNQAIKALEMLRENKDQFDLIISDVHMPDMDGFKLLELVGLEMDLPVIMLSANGETQAVMKGITHGACDYLIKPVRIEELKNIWQHVIRKKKHESRDDNSVDNSEECNNNQLANSVIKDESSDPSVKLNKKRKDQDAEDDDEDEDSSGPKKQRVVWSVELHRKFVTAVNHLGVEKAVPKRILDLMNVEGLTRENVASHLQKYRLYLKRLSAVANQQANMAAALRGRDTSYLLMNSLDGYPNFNTLNGSNSRPIQTTTSLLGMNSFTGFGHHGFPHSSNQVISSPLEASNHLLGGLSNSETSNNHPSSSRIQSLTIDPFEISYLGGNRSSVGWKFANNHTSSINIGDNVSPVVSQLAESANILGGGSDGKCSLLDFRSRGNFELKLEERIQNSNMAYMNPSMSSTPKFTTNNQNIATPLLAHNLSSVMDDDLLFDATMLPNGFDVTGYGIDDLEANVMIKPEIEDFSLLDGDAVGGSDLFSLGVL